MAKKKTDDNRAPRQIVGISMPPELARELKEEAARRGITIRALFVELWTSYKSAKAKR